MKPQTKYVILFSIYIFVVLYLLLQYLSGSNLANIEKLSSNSQKKVKKLVNEVSNELAKEYQLFKRIKSLKQKIKNLKEQHQLEILKIKGQTVSSSTNPTEMNKEPSTETKPNKETINEDSVTETKPIVIPKNDDEKYVDIDQDVHTLAEQDGVIPIIVFTYERAEYLKRCLNSLFKYIPTEGFVIYVSQDGNHQGVTNLVKTYTNRVIHLQVIIYYLLFSIQEILLFLQKRDNLLFIMQFHNIINGLLKRYFLIQNIQESFFWKKILKSLLISLVISLVHLNF